MLKIVVPSWEDWDPVNNKFLYGKEVELTLEHSLVSISKWESKYHTPYLSETPKTDDEILYYIKCMTISKPNKEINDDVYKHLSYENIKAIEEYISNPMTATTFSNLPPRRGRREVVTSELIYYWMIALNIPFECQRWHLNRLLTLVQVASIKNQPAKKMKRGDVMAQNRALNAARRAKHHSQG